MLTDLNKINLETDEGKLLFASIIELTTKVHTHSTPDEVIKKLWCLHEETQRGKKIMDAGENGACLKASPNIFWAAIEKSYAVDEEKINKDRTELIQAGDVILRHADCLPGSVRRELTGTLVAIYRSRMKIM